MGFSIGKHLGATVALLENSLSEDYYDDEMLQRLALVSEAYKNFSIGNLEGFKEGFELGYDKVAKELASVHSASQENTHQQNANLPPKEIVDANFE